MVVHTFLCPVTFAEFYIHIHIYMCVCVLYVTYICYICIYTYIYKVPNARDIIQGDFWNN